VLLGSTALGLVLWFAGAGSNSIGTAFWGLLIIIAGSICVWVWGGAQGIAPWRSHAILKIFFWGSLLLSLGLLLMSWASKYPYESIYFFFGSLATLINLITTFVRRW
jgi:hypothetical protein